MTETVIALYLRIGSLRTHNLQPSSCNLTFFLENVEVVRAVGDSPEGRSPQ